MKAWKVLTNGRYSCSANAEIALHYPVGVTVRPEKDMPPLFAFKTKEQAEDWTSQSNYLIVPCRVKLSRTKFKYMIDGGWYMLKENLMRIWKRRPSNLYYSNWTSPPDGTIFCSQITCLE